MWKDGVEQGGSPFRNLGWKMKAAFRLGGEYEYMDPKQRAGERTGRVWRCGRGDCLGGLELTLKKARISK